MPFLLALLTMITTVHPANLLGTWHGKSGTLTIGKVLKHTNGTQQSYPGEWSADGTTLHVHWLSGRNAIFLPDIECPYTLKGGTLTLEGACFGIEGIDARR
jgi:hypothetical protein